jgi:hypothetical protein
VPRGIRVVEVDRSGRQDRRRQGKSDPLDAVSAAGPPSPAGTPKGRDGTVEAIRALMVAKHHDTVAVFACCCRRWLPAPAGAACDATSIRRSATSQRCRGLAPALSLQAMISGCCLFDGGTAAPAIT